MKLNKTSNVLFIIFQTACAIFLYYLCFYFLNKFSNITVALSVTLILFIFNFVIFLLQSLKLKLNYKEIKYGDNHYIYLSARNIIKKYKSLTSNKNIELKVIDEINLLNPAFAYGNNIFIIKKNTNDYKSNLNGIISHEVGHIYSGLSKYSSILFLRIDTFFLSAGQFLNSKLYLKYTKEKNSFVKTLIKILITFLFIIFLPQIITINLFKYFDEYKANKFCIYSGYRDEICSYYAASKNRKSIEFFFDMMLHPSPKKMIYKMFKYETSNENKQKKDMIFFEYVDKGYIDITDISYRKLLDKYVQKNNQEAMYYYAKSYKSTNYSLYRNIISNIHPNSDVLKLKIYNEIQVFSTINFQNFDLCYDYKELYSLLEYSVKEKNESLLLNISKKFSEHFDYYGISKTINYMFDINIMKYQTYLYDLLYIIYDAQKSIMASKYYFIAYLTGKYEEIENYTGKLNSTSSYKYSKYVLADLSYNNKYKIDLNTTLRYFIDSKNLGIKGTYFKIFKLYYKLKEYNRAYKVVKNLEYVEKEAIYLDLAIMNDFGLFDYASKDSARYYYKKASEYNLISEEQYNININNL